MDKVRIADGVIIGINAVVTKGFLEPYTSWAGAPARKKNDIGYIERVEKFKNELTGEYNE